VKRVVMEAHARAVSVLTEYRSLLDIVATQLLERETLTRDDIILLKDGKPLGPRPQADGMPGLPIPVTPAIAPTPRPVVPPLLGGPEIAPA
jgi:cell division protease FtsH